MQQAHGPGLVFVLRPLVLALDDDAGWQVGQAHCRIRFVDVLPAGTRGTIGIDSQVVLVDIDFLDVIELRQYRYGAGRGMDTALRFSLRHPLNPVRTRFKFHLAVSVTAIEPGDDFLEAAMFTRPLIQHLDLPFLGLSVAAVHPEQVAREDRGFVAASAGTDFEEDVVGIMRILRQQQFLQRRIQFNLAGLEGLNFHLGHFADLRVRVIQHLFRVFELLALIIVLAKTIHYGFDVSIFLRQGTELALVGDHLAVRKQGTQFLITIE